MAAKGRTWLKLFQQFIGDLRIKSKEISTSDPRGAPLVLWESQKRFIREVGQGLDEGIHIFNCLKSRQQGATTVSLAIDLFWLAMHDNMIGVLVTDTEDNKMANRKLLEHYLGSFDPEYFDNKFSLKMANRNMLAFSNGSQLNFRVAGTRMKGLAWAEGVGYSLIHMTEVAKYGNPEGIKTLQEGFAQNNPHRLLIKESTAYGMNHWRDQWMAGKVDPHTQRSFFIGWWANDMNRIERSDRKFVTFGEAPPVGEERTQIRAVKELYGHTITHEQLAWFRWRQSSAGQEQDLLEQNQPWTENDAFVMTGYSFFAIGQLTRDVKRIRDGNAARGAFTYRGYRYIYGDDFFSFHLEELEQSDDNKRLVELKVWDEPKANGRYAIGYDPGYGKTMHGDAAAITVWRCYADRMVQAAEYCTRDVDIRHTAWVFFHLCAAYGDVLANYDVQGPGRIVIIEFEHLRQLISAEHNYEKTRARKWDDAGASVRDYLYRRPDSLGAGYAKGYDINSWRAKGELYVGFRSSYVTGELEIKSIRFLEEMRNVVVNDDIIGALDSSDETKKDDRVTSGLLAVKAWTDWIKKEMLALGQTLDAVTRAESGEKAPLAQGVNDIVYRFLARQEELANAEPRRGSEWQERNGLV